jgi:formyltetrahydrofolate deformylase
MPNETYRLIYDCPDQLGLIAKTTQFIASHHGCISESTQHTDAISKRFFSRIEIQANSLDISVDEFKTAFAPIATACRMNWKLVESSYRQKVVILASRQSHCLSDLLDRWHSNDLHCDIVAVISNHNDQRALVEHYGIDYHHIPVGKENKTQAFAKITALIDEYATDTIVLARYMQILPKALCDKYPQRILNIHHSFLPSFVGAKPYHQAAARGVKLIGATCHYVTQELDEGPIIEQDVERVSHAENIEDLVRLGKDIEKRVLARGLRYHLEDRVMVDGNKTVILS